jgi:hypothetical protein
MLTYAALLQFRMHPLLADFSSVNFYGGLLGTHFTCFTGTKVQILTQFLRGGGCHALMGGGGGEEGGGGLVASHATAAERPPPPGFPWQQSLPVC